MKKFIRRKIESQPEKYILIKCENEDGSLSYRLGLNNGLLINHSLHRKERYEDELQDKQEIHRINRYNLKKSVLGDTLDVDLNKIQSSFTTFFEELFIKI